MANKTKYIIVSSRDEGQVVIATVQGEKVTGPRAQDMEELLRELGWPEQAPDKVLHGSRLFAQEVRE